jgi:hypothetical protein
MNKRRSKTEINSREEIENLAYLVKYARATRMKADARNERQVASNILSCSLNCTFLTFMCLPNRRALAIPMYVIR